MPSTRIWMPVGTSIFEKKELVNRRLLGEPMDPKVWQRLYGPWRRRPPEERCTSDLGEALEFAERALGRGQRRSFTDDDWPAVKEWFVRYYAGGKHERSRLPAEMASLLQDPPTRSMIPRKGEALSIRLLTTDTPQGVLAATLIRELILSVAATNWSCALQSLEVTLLEGVQPYSSETFLDQGFKSIRYSVTAEVEEAAQGGARLFFNLTGGLKAVYLPVVKTLLEVQPPSSPGPAGVVIAYLHEASDELLFYPVALRAEGREAGSIGRPKRSTAWDDARA